MVGARQRIGHMIVIGHPTNPDVWSVTKHKVFLVLQPASHNAGIRQCEWGNNNSNKTNCLVLYLGSGTWLEVVIMNVCSF